MKIKKEIKQLRYKLKNKQMFMIMYILLIIQLSKKRVIFTKIYKTGIMIKFYLF